MTIAQSTAPPVRDQDLVLSGGGGRSSNSARAGFLPIGLEHVPIGAMQGIAVYVRVRADTGAPGRGGSSAGETGAAAADPHQTSCFRLYCASNIRFGDFHRRRLLEHGVRFVYIRMADQSRFRQQTEANLGDVAADSGVGVSERAAIIYETSVEMMNELLDDPEVMVHSPRLEQVSRSIATLVMNNPTSFSHLFAVSHHDFYTATHLVNVGTWMVPLAYELGFRDPEELNRICKAGFLHDMGKLQVPEDILNKTGKLSDEEWAQIKRHPTAGGEYLARFGDVHPQIMAVTTQHHERMDGSGYPAGLKGDQIDRVSRICAVVDSFDAMTAFRPFKQRTLSVADTLEILQQETPSKYDPEVLAAWMALMRRSQGQQPPSPAGAAPPPVSLSQPRAENQRRHQRQSFNCPARAHLLVPGLSDLSERPAIPVVAHSISRSGLGFLCPQPIAPGEFVRIYLQAKGRNVRTLEGQIVRSRSYNDTWHEVGMQFARVDTDATMPVAPPAA
jgi:HD-GYP domain-containing protein (c-di-GMP phosphodiesterase class II)